MNPDTGFSKGTAFVQFHTKEMADECVKTLEDEKSVRSYTINLAAIKHTRSNELQMKSVGSFPLRSFGLQSVNMNA